MARADAPFGIIGRGCDDLHLVAAPGEPGRHLAGELADAGGLGREIKAIDQNAHEGSVLARDDGKTVAKAQAIVEPEPGEENAARQQDQRHHQRGSRRAPFTLPGRAVNRAMISLGDPEGGGHLLLVAPALRAAWINGTSPSHRAFLAKTLMRALEESGFEIRN